MPCYKLGMKFGRDDVLKLLFQNGFSGFYCAVLQEGEVAAGDPVRLLHRDEHAVTVRDIVHLQGEGQVRCGPVAPGGGSRSAVRKAGGRPSWSVSTCSHSRPLEAVGSVGQPWRTSMSKTRPFRFGIKVATDPGDIPTREAWIALARKAEDLGYATFSIADHVINEYLPIAALMFVADATRTLRIGSCVFDNNYRHPVLLAKEVAALDLLSGGRFELGLGAGSLQIDYDQSGLPFDRPGVRIQRLAESVALLKQFFTQDAVTFAGEHYTVTIWRPSPNRRSARIHPSSSAVEARSCSRWRRARPTSLGWKRSYNLAREAAIPASAPRRRWDKSGVAARGRGRALCRHRVELWVPGGHRHREPTAGGGAARA